MSLHPQVQIDPFFLEEFKTTPLGIVASRAISERAKEIISAADHGDPPIAVLAPLLKPQIDENLQWRMVERLIAEWLGSGYQKAERKASDVLTSHRGRCYVRLPDARQQ